MPVTSDGRADRLQGFTRLFELAPFVGHKMGAWCLTQAPEIQRNQVL